MELQKSVSPFELISLFPGTHIKLLRYIALIAMEGDTIEHMFRLLHQFHGIHCSIVPVMIVTDDLDTREPIIVQEPSECYPNSSLL